MGAMTGEEVMVDGVWVRKWKKLASGEVVMKSRFCARGCFDTMKGILPTRFTTATRLSQPLLVSLAALLDLELQSWDISGAFLKGYSFEKMADRLRSKGIDMPRCKVCIQPPPNVWRHFGDLSNDLKINLGKIDLWFLEALKAMYGLVDAPVGRQICLLDFAVADRQGQQSHFDECFLMWFWPDGQVRAWLLLTLMTKVWPPTRSGWTQPARSSARSLARQPKCAFLSRTPGRDTVAPKMAIRSPRRVL